MTEETLRSFCEYRHRSLIVIAGTFVVGLLLVLPSVDVYYAGRDEKSGIESELDSARHVASELTVYEQRVKEKLGQLATFEARAVDDESLPVLRGKLVDLAKETGCSIRRLSVGAISTRPWAANDDPVTPKPVVKTGEEKTTGFALEWRPVSVSLSGSSENLRTLLERVAAMGMFMHTKSFELYPGSQNRQSLTLDMELWFFTLARRGANKT